MSHSSEKTKPLGLQLPIPEQARLTAQQFARSQPTPEKAEQVLLNSLAVWVTNDYCQMMGILTDLEHSDSWNPVMQMMANTADLTLPGVGQLECRPVAADVDRCLVPPEVWDMRVGYVVVEIDGPLQTAQLLGFTPAVSEEVLLLTDLAPLEDLLDHLYELRQAVSSPAEVMASGVAIATEAVINLNQWLNDTFEVGWQTVESVLNPDTLTPAMGFRGGDSSATTELNPPSGRIPDGIRRAKLIDLAVQMGTQQLVMLIELQPESPQRTHIGVQIHPMLGQPFLPPALELFVLESTDVVFMQAQSRQADNYVQLQFSGTPGERFKVRVSLGDASYVETFVI
ncbi:MAG: DUF1822 family protein [Leptolyngbyaceae cyanobacterium]